MQLFEVKSENEDVEVFPYFLHEVGIVFAYCLCNSLSKNTYIL
jgi:hypothetical protein